MSFYPGGTVPYGYPYKPTDVSNDCDHNADPPVCNCVHDWRIEWGNVKRTIKGEFGSGL